MPRQRGEPPRRRTFRPVEAVAPERSPRRLGAWGASATPHASGSKPASLVARRTVRLTAAGLSGAALALTLPPFDFLPALCAYAALLGLLLACEGLRRPALERAIVGAAFGFGYHLAGLWWIGAAFLVDADTFGAFLPAAVVGLPLLLAPYHALAAVLVGLAPQGLAWRAVGLACAIAATEWLRSVLFTGFPWNAAGVGLSGSLPLAQSASVAGTAGLAIPAVLLGVAPILMLARSGRLALAAIASFVAVMTVYGSVRLANPPGPSEALDGRPTVRVVQPSIDQATKWDPAHRDAIWRRLLDLSDGPPVDVVIWPETALPFYYRTGSRSQAQLTSALQGTARHLITGAVTKPDEGDPRARNSMLVLDDEGRIVERYDKVRLVPFGEYLPARDLLSALGLRKLTASAASFGAGAARRPLHVDGLPPAEPLICYEVIFSAPHLGDEVGWIVNLTNDAWFGDTPGPRQHLRHAQLRAIERGLPVVRAANNGVSAIIEADGRLTRTLPHDAIGTIDAVLPRQRRALYSTVGDAPLLVSLVALLAICVYLQSTRGRTSSTSR